VVLRVKTKEKFLNLLARLEESGVPYAPIFDACRTELEPEEPNGTTLTCAGLVPMFRSDVPEFVRKLQIYT
ncbi:MAG: peptidyl-tRNA hydrolase, partial [Planctomycetes bacterium]|nr:peptidyl-tRNA hydrolase [Planctomycetota bacterium]